MIDLKIADKMDDGNVLIAAKKKKSSKQPTEYYSVKEEKADEFIKGRKSADLIDRLQRTLTIPAALSCGYLSTALFKGRLAKAVTGIAVTVASYKAFHYADKKVNDSQVKNLLKRTEAKDVTSEMTE